MDELSKERIDGIDWEVLGETLKERQEVGEQYITPLASHLGQLFAVTAEKVIQKLGPHEGEELLKDIIEKFAEERGRRVAEKVKAQGKPLTLKNFIVHSDLDAGAVTSDIVPSIEDGDLLLEIGQCNICKGADDWDMRDYAHYYCKYIDVAILKAYNPELELKVSETLTGGDESCKFRYRVKR